MIMSRNEKDRAKQIQEKCQTILDQLLKDEDNKYCVDCDAKGPRWASWNIGIFLCIRCAGIHRNLGVHISKVKSVNLDTWTPEQVVSLQQMGNSRARAVYEANLPDAFRRPQTDSALEAFIRAKYEHRKYVAREWVPPSPPQVNWDKEIDEEIERQKKKKKSSSSSSATLGATAIPSPAEKKTVKSSEVPQPLPKPKSSASPKPGRATPKRDTSSTADLLVSTASPANEAKSQNQPVEDVFSSFLSAPQASSDTNKNVEVNKPLDLKTEEESFFNQPAPTEKEKSKMTKDSILALYGQAPAQSLGNQSFTSNPYSSTFPNQMMSQTQFPQNTFAQGFNNFPVQNSSFPAQNSSFPAQNSSFPSHNSSFPTQNSSFPTQNSSFPTQNGATQQSNLAILGGQGSGFNAFSQFPNSGQMSQQSQQSSFNQLMQPNHFQQQNVFGQQQNTFSSMPAQFPQVPGQFQNMNGFQTSNNHQNGQQIFPTNNLQQQFGNMSIGQQGANSFPSGPQSLTNVFPTKAPTSNSVWQ